MTAQLQLSPATQRQLLRIKLALLRAGWPAVLGIILGSSALIVDTTINDQTELQLHRLQKEKRTLHQQWLVQKSAEQPPVLDVDDLPASTSLNARIGSLHHLAQQRQLRLDQGEYRIEQGADSRLARCRITFPAHGTYPDLRRWLEDIADNDKGVIVDGLIIKRPDANSERLEARVQLTLLERRE